MDQLQIDVAAQMETLKGSYIVIKLPALPAFATISAIQLATRHPAFPENMRPWVSQIARLLIDALSPDPKSPLHKVYMMGWDPAHDYVRRPDPAPLREEDIGAGRRPDPVTCLVGETATNGPFIQCLLCGSISFNPHDIENLYCGQCKQFHPIEPTRSMMTAGSADDQPPADGGPL